MIAQSIYIFIVVGVIAATPVQTGHIPPYKGVDPNTLSCDPQGQIHLLLPHFTDCSKFYMCDHGREVERTCGNLLFDFEEQVCNWDWATKCWLRDQVIDGSGDGDGSGWTEEELDDAVPKPAPSTFLPTLDCSKAESASARLSYSGDCQRFWRCSSGVLQSSFCTDGLFFNAQTQMCDYEANVKCLTQDDELTGEFIVYK